MGQAWQSKLVSFDANGRLVYQSDAEGNRIPDFSCAGYHNRERRLPDVPTVETISPIPGDNTSHIQAAIDAAGQRPVGPDGFRGVVLLQAGEYEVAGTIRLNHSGVVLRGAGDGANPATDTLLRAVGNTPAERDVIVVGSGLSTRWAGEVSGTRTNITSSFVPVASRTFTVASAGALKAGDNVIIVHPCTQDWLDAIDGGGTATDPPWRVDEQPIIYNRYVTAIDGNRVTVDVPVFNHLDQSLSQCFLYRWDRAGLVTEVGVEHLRVDIAFAGNIDEDENHAKNAIRLFGVEDAWVRRCTMLHFWFAGVDTVETTRATITQCTAIDPASLITGGRRYNFATYRYSQHILFVDCFAGNARHAYASNGTSSVSGVVFLRGTAQFSHNASEGHRRWSQGLLYDNHVEVAPNVPRVLGLFNRGDFGTAHGWSAAHSVAWNGDMAGETLVVQKPPTAQNYAIGCFGNVTGTGPHTQPAGHIEGTGQPGLTPQSLFEAQLADRLGIHAAEGRLSFLRVHEAGTKFGPPGEQLDVEVVVRLDTPRDMAFGFQLRPDSSEAARKGMLDTLRTAFNRDRRVRLDYSQTGPTTGIIIRVADLT